MKNFKIPTFLFLMKLFFASLFIVILSLEVNATSFIKDVDDFEFNKRNTIITFSPFGLVNKIRFKIERSPNIRWSYGLIYSKYYKGLVTPGTKLAPFARLYLGGQAPHGWYIEGQLPFGFFSGDILYLEDCDLSGYSFTEEVKFVPWGFGVSFGHQGHSGQKKTIVFDINIGFKFFYMSIPSQKTVGTSSYCSSLSNVLWYTTGPGSFFDPFIGIGGAFPIGRKKKVEEVRE
ncbi:MAG: hypothetical protein COC01_00615 [Bacteroidetes bacterium]|nr:MAG: hypothetical protein COC01_00615 [Bacteroidota bacterium]